MTQEELATIQQQLIALQQRLSRTDKSLKEEIERPLGADESGGRANTQIQFADIAASAAEKDVTLQVIHSEEHQLGEISAALTRITSGTFGQCEECSKKIAKARLQALPYARYCVHCETKREEAARR